MGLFLLVLSNLIFPLAALGVVLGFLFSPRRQLLKHLKAELRERFALEKEGSLPQGALWLHCASVGEVKSMANTISLLKKHYKTPILVTTSTQAGKEAALKNKEIDAAVLAPLDFYPAARRFIRLTRPKFLFLVEREIWPNLLEAAHRQHVPTALLNGRISKKSAVCYRCIKPLFTRVLAPLRFAALQTQEDAHRYERLGIQTDKIFVCGNVKYDTLCDTPARIPEARRVLNELGWSGKPIFVLGSTHPLEETVLLRAATDILKTGTKIVFAPRHLERREEFTAALKQSGLRYALVSHGKFEKETDILCIDQMGFLQAFYACAALTFVGGSMAPRGAHNLLEPAILGKTVLFGPHFYNTPLTAQALLEQGGGVLVNEYNFKEKVLQLLAAPTQLENMAAKARATALSFKGATDKMMEVIYDNN